MLVRFWRKKTRLLSTTQRFQAYNHVQAIDALRCGNCGLSEKRFRKGPRFCRFKDIGVTVQYFALAMMHTQERRQRS